MNLDQQLGPEILNGLTSGNIEQQTQAFKEALPTIQSIADSNGAHIESNNPFFAAQEIAAHENQGFDFGTVGAFATNLLRNILGGDQDQAEQLRQQLEAEERRNQMLLLGLGGLALVTILFLTLKK